MRHAPEALIERRSRIGSGSCKFERLQGLLRLHCRRLQERSVGMKILVGMLVSLLCLRVSVLAQVESLRIGPGDQIEIQVFDTPDLNEITHVNDRGEVTLRLGGSLRLASLTPDQAAHAVEAVLVNKRIMYA